MVQTHRTKLMKMEFEAQDLIKKTEQESENIHQKVSYGKFNRELKEGYVNW